MRATGDLTSQGSHSRAEICSSSTSSMAGGNPSSTQQHAGLPQPKHSQDVDELIHFVRNYQGLQRETTDLRLKRHALLPGIGQAGPGSAIVGDTPESQQHRLCDLQEEVQGVMRADIQRTDGYNSDSDLEVELQSSFQDRRRTPSPPPLWRSDPNPLGSTSSIRHSPRYLAEHHHHQHASDNRGPSHRLNNHQGRLKLGATSGGGPGPIRGGGSGGGGGGGAGMTAHRRITADVHQLPPIQLQQVPERPDAPVPYEAARERPKSAGVRRRRTSPVFGDSFTDRLARHSDDEDGEPVDYT